MLGGHGLFTWARRRQGLLRDHAAHHPAARSDWLDANNQREPRSAARASRRCPRASGAAASPTPDAAAARPDRRRRAQGRPFRRQRRRCWSSSTRTRLEALAALGTSCPDHFLRTKIRPLVARPAERRRRASCDRLSSIEPTATTTPPTTSAAGTRTRPAMRDPNPVVYLVPGVGMLTFAARQGDRADRRRVLRQRHQRDARRRRRRRLRRPARAGGVRHRVLAARGGQAAAHAQAEGARRPDRAGHRRGRRHRPGDGARGCWPRAPAWC